MFGDTKVIRSYQCHFYVNVFIKNGIYLLEMHTKIFTDETMSCVEFASQLAV